MELEEGEVICPRCNGTGYDPNQGTYWPKQYCKKCRGNKKIDWIENIVGVKEKEREHDDQIDIVNYMASVRLTERGS